MKCYFKFVFKNKNCLLWRDRTRLLSQILRYQNILRLSLSNAGLVTREMSVQVFPHFPLQRCGGCCVNLEIIYHWEVLSRWRGTRKTENALCFRVTRNNEFTFLKLRRAEKQKTKVFSRSLSVTWFVRQIKSLCYVIYIIYTPPPNHFAPSHTQTTKK